MSLYLRPDEKATRSEVERSHQIDKSFKKAGTTALAAGSSIVGAGIASRLLPFLNEYISPEIAIAGITKLSPKLGAFLQRGMQSGLDIKEGLNYIKENIMPKEEKTEEQQLEQPQPPQEQAPQSGSLKELLASGQVLKPQPGQGYPSTQPQMQQPQTPQQKQQQGQGDAALLAALDKILRM